MTTATLAMALFLAFVVGCALGRHTGKYRASQLAKREELLQRYARNLGRNLKIGAHMGSAAGIEHRLRELLDQELPALATYEINVERSTRGGMKIAVDVRTPWST